MPSLVLPKGGRATHYRTFVLRRRSGTNGARGERDSTHPRFNTLWRVSMPATPITDWGTAFMTSMAAALALLLGGVPKIIAFAFILIVGWIVASIVGGAVRRLLQTIQFERFAERSGLRGFIRKMGTQISASQLVGEMAKWLIRLVALVVAFDALGLPAVSQALQSLLLWLPNLIVAIVVLVLGGLAATALSRVVRGATAEAGFANPDLLATITSVAVWAFAVLIAVNQVGVAANIVNILFTGIVAAAALAFGLAFGLGGRDVANRLLVNWYQRSGDVSSRIPRGADPARQQASASEPESTRRMSEPAENGDLVQPGRR